MSRLRATVESLSPAVCFIPAVALQDVILRHLAPRLGVDHARPFAAAHLLDNVPGLDHSWSVDYRRIVLVFWAPVTLFAPTLAIRTLT